MGKQINISTERVYSQIEQATQTGRKPRKTYTDEEKAQFQLSGKTSGKKGVKLPRLNLGITSDVQDYVKVMARVSGLNMTEFINLVLREHMAAHKEKYQQAKDFYNSL